MNWLFYEREESPPQEDKNWRFAAQACSKQRDQLRFFEHELEDVEGFLQEMRFLPSEIKEQVRQVYVGLLEGAKQEYEKRRAVLLEMGYDDEL